MPDAIAPAAVLASTMTTPRDSREVFVRVSCLVLLGSLLVPAAAGGSMIEFSNVSLRSWNGVIVHEPGASTSYFVVNEYDASSGPDAVVSTDVGFASLEALSQPFSLHPTSRVDATGIDLLGYDYVVAEAGAHFEADFTITGGSGPVDVLLSTSFLEISSTDEPGFAIDGIRRLRIFDGPDIVYAVSGATGSELLTLEHDVTYHLDTSFNAYSRATLGHQTSNSRDVELSFSVVPEPDSGLLLALGLAGLHAGRRRRRRGG
jgi:MYXO-CTERM domain-containing protein